MNIFSIFKSIKYTGPDSYGAFEFSKDKIDVSEFDKLISALEDLKDQPIEINLSETISDLKKLNNIEKELFVETFNKIQSGTDIPSEELIKSLK